MIPHGPISRPVGQSFANDAIRGCVLAAYRASLGNKLSPEQPRLIASWPRPEDARGL